MFLITIKEYTGFEARLHPERKVWVNEENQTEAWEKVKRAFYFNTVYMTEHNDLVTFEQVADAPMPIEKSAICYYRNRKKSHGKIIHKAGYVTRLWN